MTQLRLDPTTHDLSRSGGTFERADAGEEIRQNIKVRLLLFRGEAWLDTALGIPYFAEVLRKGIDEASLTNIFREAILGSDGVTALEALDLSFVPAARRLDVSFVALGSLDELADDLKIEDTIEVPI